MPSAENTPKEVFLIVADVWKEKDSEPVLVHLLLTAGGEEDIVTTALNILADQDYEEAEVTEVGTITEEPEEEPYKSAWKTALSGEAALIEFEGE
ncbi:hypothetical protein GCM10011491_04870 [Brucella endophytica]|uniref:Uncharacterized protein n=1 Tax=Brucella endophytica TaxID=1963359 RepID=A0A916W9R8_9HYPH|nr:hypothetical protein [Brucella endophytica]GGA80624.1 hypothetical protein GCM10011491_04870 [Brucella endophytica]